MQREKQAHMRILPITYNYYTNYNKQKTRSNTSQATFSGGREPVVPKRQQPINSSLYSRTKPAKAGRKDFKLSYAQTLVCPCCGKTMKDDPEYEKAAREISESKGTDLIYILLKHRERIKDGKKDIITAIKNEAVQHPERNLQELLNLSKEKHLASLKHKQIEIIDNFLPTHPAANNDPKSKKLIQSWFDHIKATIDEAQKEGDFRNKNFIQYLVELNYKFDCHLTEDEIRKYFEKLPKSTTDDDAYFVKYGRRSSLNIAKSLLYDVTPTIEHIFPFERSENNTASNLLVMCADCNNERMQVPYPIFIQRHPEMVENCQRYIDSVKKELNNEKYTHTKYITYPEKIKSTLYDASGGLIDIEI